METRPKFYNESEVSLEKSSFEISGAEIQQNYHNLHHNSFTLMKKYSEKVEILDKFPFSSFLIEISLFCKLFISGGYEMKFTTKLDVTTYSLFSGSKLFSMKLDLPPMNQRQEKWINYGLFNSSDSSGDYTTSSVVSFPNFTCKYELFMKRKTLRNDIIEEFEKLECYWRTSSAYQKFKEFDVFSDFKFKVKDKEFKVHKIVLSQASDVIKTMLTSNFEESRENSASLDNVDSNVFEILVDFIYGDKDSFGAKSSIDLLYKIFEAAHYYQIENLQHYCIARIFKNLTDNDNILETYSFSWKYDITDLKEYCWEKIQFEFLRLIVPKSSPPSASKVTEYIKNVEKLEKDWRDIKNKFKDLSSNLVSDVTNIDKLSLLGSIEASLTYTFDYEFDDKNDSEKN